MSKKLREIIPEGFFGDAKRLAGHGLPPRARGALTAAVLHGKAMGDDMDGYPEQAAEKRRRRNDLLMGRKTPIKLPTS